MGREVSISSLSLKQSESGPLEGLATHRDIESLVVFRETAREVLARLKPDSKKARQIREALSELENSHHVADSMDSDGKCNSRRVVRGRWVI